MLCSEVRQYVFAFLDNELDAPLSIELQCHLETCPQCARECEIERVIRRQLVQTLETQVAANAVDTEREFEHAMARVFERPPRDASMRGRKKRRWLVPLGGIAVLGFAIALFLGSPRGSSKHFVDLLVADFEHFQERGRLLQVSSSQPDVVSDWLAKQTALPVRLPVIHEMDGRLLGARKCKIDGKPAAFAVYELKNALASLVVMPGSDHDLETMERVQDGAHIHWVDRCKGHTVLACKRGALVYAAVSTLPEGALRPLMIDAEH